MNTVLMMTIRNIKPYEDRLIDFIREIKDIFRGINIIITSSDADEQNRIELDRLVKKDKDIEYKYLGNLSERHQAYSMTSNRVAKGRNEYMKMARKYRPEVVIMVDADNRLPGVSALKENKANLQAYARYLSSGMCDGIFANTIGRYYDIWALRDDECNYDCHLEINNRSAEMSLNEAQMKYLRCHQKLIDGVSFKKVDSAFGGFGMYRWDAIAHIKYTGMTYQKGKYRMICEHPEFHAQIENARLYIAKSLRLVPGNDENYNPINV